MEQNPPAKLNPAKVIGLFLGPILFLLILNLPLPEIFNPQAWKVIAVAVWMITWWVTEAVPLPVTALLPMILLPLLGVFAVSEATAPYASPIIFLFMGGFLIALAMEKWNLHKRIALSLIKVTGTHANGIILGFMLATAFLSMWISNTATTVMMLPIAMSVIGLIAQANTKVDKASFRKFALALLLGIAYSANVGGAATIIGTPPNVVMVGYLQEFYQYDLAFSQWLWIGIPVSGFLIFLVYFLLVKWLFPSGLGHLEGSQTLISRELEALGPISKEEKRVLIIFILTALGWILRQPINHWLEPWLGRPLLTDTIIAMSGGTAMFLWPLNLKKSEFLLDWPTTQRLPWGILLLFGGGLCLARAMEVTGIIQWVGDQISSGGPYPLWLLLFLLITVCLFMTEVMSNVALVTIFLPVVLGIADGLGLPPLLLAAPVTIAASCAFMLPVSTPPNAIVFASGYIEVKDMARGGFILNVLSVITLVIAGLTLVKWVL
ncbi:MAG: SLC13 family permease [Cyclobacteriaceae bacterium]